MLVLKELIFQEGNKHSKSCWDGATDSTGQKQREVSIMREKAGPCEVVFGLDLDR